MTRAGPSGVKKVESGKAGGTTNQNGRIASSFSTVRVTKVERRVGKASVKVYNFVVADYHTYFVGSTTVGKVASNRVGQWVWVHNGPCDVPGEYLAGKAPMQVQPGIRTLEGQYVNSMGRVEPWKAHYDGFGRQIGRTDYNAGNATAGIPSTHNHTYGYFGGRRSGTWMETGSHIPGEFVP